MNPDNISCPECCGHKIVLVTYFPGTPRHPPMPCRVCGGSGQITLEHHNRIEAGEKMREDRIERGVSLRAEAARLGITPCNLSDLENGRQVLAPVSEKS